MKKSLLSVAALVAVALLSAVGPAAAQCSSQAMAPGVTVETNAAGTTCDAVRGNFQQTDSANSNSASLLSGTLQGAGTLNSTQFVNYDGKGVVCTWSQTAESGDPNTVINLQAYDAASGTYSTFLTSGTLYDNLSPSQVVRNVILFPGILTTSLPAAVSAAANLVLPRLWRVQVVISGSATPLSTFTIGCNIVK